MNTKDFFQNHMPGNICFGCGKDNHEGLQIKSYWEGEEAICIWNSKEKYQGWKGVLHGGILASLVDCHCMCTAMAAQYRSEGRDLESTPIYRYATGTLTIKYLKPTYNDVPIVLKAIPIIHSEKKIEVNCRVFSNDELTAEANVIAIKVFDSSQEQEGIFDHGMSKS